MKQVYPTAASPFSVNAHTCCWYCNQQLNDMRRFCNKVCAEAFEEDEMAMERRMLRNAEVPVRQRA